MAEKRGAFGNIIDDLSSLRDMFSKEDENLKNEEEQKTKLEELLDFQTAKEEYKPTEEQKTASTLEDYGTQPAEEILVQEEKEQVKEKKETLDEKLANIEKVIDKFTTQTPLGTGAKLDMSSLDINVPALDLSKTYQKDYIEQILQKSSSQMDRVSLLYQNLKKQGLI
jgi:hypothetical protein